MKKSSKVGHKKKRVIFIVSCILIIILLIIGGFCLYYKNSNDNVKINVNDKLVANIYYSYNDSIDAGAEYFINIYSNGKNKYKYQVFKSEITIAGVGEQEEVEKGIINSKLSLSLLDKKYKNNKYIGSEVSSISYTYYKNDKAISLSSIKKLGNKMFN